MGFEVFTTVNMINTVFWAVAPRGSFKTDVSEERIAFIRVKKSAS
jgi:hypothetical protein